MEVSQVVQLADWFRDNFQAVGPKLQNLVDVLQHNSQQANQQPVTDPLKELTRALRAMPTSELSTLQLRVLEELGVAEFVGKAGRAWVIRTVQTKTYDPATTYQTVADAHQRMQNAQNHLKTFKDAATQLGFESTTHVDAPTPYVFNVIFQQDAAIKNVSDWKKTAADWELILGSIANATGHRAQDIAFVGGQNGSFILTLSAAPIITKVLAVISKHIASIANDYLDFQLKREDLRRSRIMSDVIEKELNRQEKDRRSEAKTALMESIRGMLPKAKPEELSKLEKAIDRHIDFSEKGGEVDFILPPALDLEDEAIEENLAETVNDLRDVIQYYRSEIQKTKLLTNQEDADFDDN